MRDTGTSVEVDHLVASYTPDEIIIDDLSMSIRPGEFACILGPSGCGKSTLLSILSGLKTPQSGVVRVGGADVHAAGSTPEDYRLGYVFQDHRLLPWRTVYENVAFALKAAQVPESEHRGIITEYLTLLQIENLADAWPMAMSGGQRQRASIARALAINPAFVLMDEPFSTLDEVTARVLRQELLRVWERTSKTIIFVTHSIREAVLLADRVFILAARPGRLHRILEVDLPRPRGYEDPRLTQIEADVVSDVLKVWGLPGADPVGAK